MKRIGVFDGDFANFAGFHGGWLIDLSFLIGMAGYGTFVDWKWAMVGCFSSTSSTSTSSSTIHPRFDWRRGADNYGNRHHGPGHDVDGWFLRCRTGSARHAERFEAISNRLRSRLPLRRRLRSAVARLDTVMSNPQAPPEAALTGRVMLPYLLEHGAQALLQLRDGGPPDVVYFVGTITGGAPFAATASWKATSSFASAARSSAW